MHEFEDRSLLLILTEYSRAQPVEISSIKDFFWTPRIAAIMRPVIDVSLRGIISGISDSSGLVKRCDECRRVIFSDECPQGCKKGWSWDVRVSARLYDGSGTMQMILTRSVAARILQRSIGEILYLANNGKATVEEQFFTQSFTLNLPKELEILEAFEEEDDDAKADDDLEREIDAETG